MTERQLTPKQQRFLDAYLGEARGNGAEAARIAGYSDPEISAFDCKRNPVIRARIEERLLAESLSSAEVLRELTDVATAPTEHFMTVVHGEERDRQGNVIAPMQVKLDYSSKVKSLELLGKYHKLFTDKVEHTGNVSGSVEIKPIDYRAIVAPLLSDESEA